MKKTARLNLVRKNTVSGTVMNVLDITYKDAQDRVAWCAVDNLNMSKKDASAAASKLAIGELLQLGGYTFLATAV